MLRYVPIAVAIGLWIGCGTPGAFGCTDDAQCDPGAGGICVAPGYCAFPDDACGSGLVYGGHAPGGYAGVCVPVEEGSGDSGSGPGSSVSTTSSASSSGSSPLTSASDGDSTLSLDDGSSSSGGGSSDGDPTDSSPPSTTSSTTAPGTEDGGSTSSGSAVTVVYPADLATCAHFELPMPDPVTCEADAEPDSFTVDGEMNVSLAAVAGYLAFTLDDQIEAGTIEEVRLRLRTAPDASAESSSSGEVWAVEAFTEADLLVATPGQVGNAPLAGTLGAVAADQDVVFTLPEDAVAPGAAVYLGIFPLSTNGVDYRDETTATPPALEVDLTP